MKKMLSSLALALAVLGSHAQEKSERHANENLKPVRGTVSTELNINLFSSKLNFNNALNQIKFRYFLKAQTALRLGAHVSSQDSSFNVNNPYGNASSFTKDERKGIDWALNFGIEHHFPGSRRLSPYVGLDASIAGRSASQTFANPTTTVDTENGWYNFQSVVNPTAFYLSRQAYSRWGVNLVAGFDFYMSRAFFFGYEFNLGAYQTNYKNASLRTVNQSGAVTTQNLGKSESFKIGPTLFNGIRLGYNF
ncbi:hypothetical protein C7T94_18810 [Pedobacter yulinensis]|uniref:Outer membrane protein beta-barrel domain-containing protein n=1 Tax=Pedobacter yulinensis TaxID=2126353 RepID=A0A2T3HGU4_9SPHI|nr:hypothetical protein [Pedobacter yulinensis]PST81666.1 hypothetical protein C7T94_18810 [Pedobacter yulinensis]